MGLSYVPLALGCSGVFSFHHPPDTGTVIIIIGNN